MEVVEGGGPKQGQRMHAPVQTSQKSLQADGQRLVTQAAVCSANGCRVGGKFAAASMTRAVPNIVPQARSMCEFWVAVYVAARE